MKRETNPKSHSRKSRLAKVSSMVGVATFFGCLLLLSVMRTHAQTVTAKAKAFGSAEEAANALIDAAEKFDEAALHEILGSDSWDIIHTDEPARDREIAKEFAALAR